MKTKGENRRASKGTIVLEAQTLKDDGILLMIGQLERKS